ncbi:hypothetical protein, conserved [Eimeria acervulina]|uniref:protein-disulfide reductase n=1 Tax=Eimeria acervulina TaxID=5801 RepID=U6GDF8_EIMAC|nr:hypothetical protein, conserved [Eimeria acervulina]CDI78185.1 hypothetical protein, conserved [Eimeria acervulina]
MFPQYCSPYNTEKRRYNEEQAMAAAAKDGAAAAAPMPPAYRDMDLILFPEGSLRDANGNVVSQQHLIVNEGGSHQKIEVVFVSADRDEASYNNHIKHMPWLVVGFHDPLRTILLRHFRVEREYAVPGLGQGPRAALPALVVVGSDGRDAQFLQVGGGRDEGERAILRWDWRNTKFGADRFLVRREG